MNYYVTISELLEREIEIEANSVEEAHEEAFRKYKEQEIVLNADDYQGTEITVLQRNVIKDKEQEQKNLALHQPCQIR